MTLHLPFVVSRFRDFVLCEAAGGFAFRSPARSTCYSALSASSFFSRFGPPDVTVTIAGLMTFLPIL